MRISKPAAYVIAIVLLAGAGWFFLGPGAPITNRPPPNPSIAMLGDSLSSGIGATRGQELPALIAERLGKPVANFGVAGDTTADALKRVPRMLEDNPGTVIVLLGGNDALQRAPRSAFEPALREIVTRCQDSGAMVVLVGFTITPGDGLNAMFKQVAKDTRCIYVPDVLGDIFFNPKMKSDQIHPNDAGYALMADRIAAAIKPKL